MSTSVTCKKNFCERYTRKKVKNLHIAKKNIDKLINITNKKHIKLVTNKIKDLERKPNKTEKYKRRLQQLQKSLNGVIQTIQHGGFSRDRN